jgi:hypothetical protein
MARTHFKLLSEIREITVISVIPVGVQHGQKKDKTTRRWLVAQKACSFTGWLMGELCVNYAPFEDW